jgi:hypothetical protein
MSGWISDPRRLTPPESAQSRRNNLIIIVLAMAMVKLVSLAFIRSTVGGSILSQLSTIWDSNFYVGIAQNGYPAGTVTGAYAFAPGYPAFIWLANLLVRNYLLSAALVSNIFSVLDVLAFYRLAQSYFSPTNSLYAALALAFFPTFVTYGLVSYSEPVYLFFAILAVYFFLKSKFLQTGIACSLAVLSGYSNILIPVVLLCVIALQRIFPRLLAVQRPLEGQGAGTYRLKLGHAWLLMPLLVLGAWVYFLGVRSGTWFPVLAVQAPWGTSIANPVAQFQSFFTGIFSTQGSPVQQLLLRYPYTLSFLALAYPLWMIDKRLSLYSSAFMLVILSLVGTSYMSGPRLMLSAWPVMLVFGKAKREYIIPVLIMLSIVSLQSTYAQLTGFWT